ncbi:hypothetical protein Rcae01_00099 [Novipirellula caenicola]|uniref:Uncharacterized protein n=1 Tax=Novipirellula caenicola TaxID=1536901 RepID=A0ABP9VHH3_9BACT
MIPDTIENMVSNAAKVVFCREFCRAKAKRNAILDKA